MLNLMLRQVVQSYTPSEVMMQENHTPSSIKHGSTSNHAGLHYPKNACLDEFGQCTCVFTYVYPDALWGNLSF